MKIVASLLCLLSLVALSGLGQGVSLSWSPVSGANAYAVYTAPSTNGPWTRSGQTAGTNFDLPPLFSGTVIRVEAGGDFTGNGSATMGAFTQLTYTAPPAVTNFVVVTNTMIVTVPGSNDCLLNGGFEQGSTNWILSGNVVLFSTNTWPRLFGAGGTNCLVFNSGDSAPTGIVSQAVKLVPGARYALTFSAGSYGAATPQSLLVTLTGQSNLVSRTVTTTGTGNFSSFFGWARYTNSFTADAQTATLTIKDTSTTTAAVDIALDSLSITTATP